MKHNFTDEQIIDAFEDAEVVGDWRAFRRVLDALPEPEDDWQPCTLDDIRKGDRVRWQVPDMEDICTFEIIASHTKRDDPVWVLYSNTDSYYFPPGAVVDRIPKKIVHPDPAEHPVILVTEYDVAGNVMEYEPTPFFAHDGVYKNDIYAHRPDGVLSWYPAKVVADND